MGMDMRVWDCCGVGMYTGIDGLWVDTDINIDTDSQHSAIFPLVFVLLDWPPR